MVVNMTIAIPDELKKEMEGVKFVNWSEVARAAFRDKLIQFQLFQKIASTSKLTKKDADELARKINHAASERLIKENGARK